MDQQVLERLRVSKPWDRPSEDRCLCSTVMRGLTTSQWEEYSLVLSSVELGDALMSSIDCSRSNFQLFLNKFKSSSGPSKSNSRPWNFSAETFQ